jgi:hypothetical protein
VTICNGCGYTRIVSTPNFTVTGDGDHRLLITGQVSFEETACTVSPCDTTISGYLGLNGIYLEQGDGAALQTLDQVGDWGSVSISQVITYGPGTYPVYLGAENSLIPGITVQAETGSIQVIQLS